MKTKGVGDGDAFTPRYPSLYIRMSVVWLNVGGVFFCTSKATLLMRGDGFFHALVSHSNESEFFVDRDPYHFRYVLNWLRGVRVLPDDKMSVEALLAEADFYNLKDMVDALTRRRTIPTCEASLQQLSRQLPQALQLIQERLR